MSRCALIRKNDRAGPPPGASLQPRQGECHKKRRPRGIYTNMLSSSSEAPVPLKPRSGPTAALIVLSERPTMPRRTRRPSRGNAARGPAWRPAWCIAPCRTVLVGEGGEDERRAPHGSRKRGDSPQGLPIASEGYTSSRDPRLSPDNHALVPLGPERSLIKSSSSLKQHLVGTFRPPSRRGPLLAGSASWRRRRIAR